jgi:hypothetical protein|tara:strand:- start:117 stop:305 length:189 start_codon:yes stop_codon:yes gene_type:complete
LIAIFTASYTRTYFPSSLLSLFYILSSLFAYSPAIAESGFGIECPVLGCPKAKEFIDPTKPG